MKKNSVPDSPPRSPAPALGEASAVFLEGPLSGPP